MTIEEKLQNLILSKYGSIREFTAQIEMPNSTYVSIIKRGIKKANIQNIIEICDELGISVDALVNGRIERLKVVKTNEASPDLQEGVPCIIENEKLSDFVEEAKTCTDSEIQLAIDMLKAFNKTRVEKEQDNGNIKRHKKN